MSSRARRAARRAFLREKVYWTLYVR
jgi:hypothetical protein